MQDPYTVLNVPRTSKPQEIKSAFRKLAKQFHPDQNQNDPNAQARFAEISQAYEILGDDERRKQFDRGEIDGEGKPMQQGFGGQGFNGGGGSERRNPFEYRSGSSSFGSDDIFDNLFGRGGGFSGFGQSRSQAPRKGADLNVSINISLEQAVGAETVEAIFPSGKKLKIKLPNYVENGQVIRLKGQGESSPNGSAGDALITINLRPHSRFREEGRVLNLDLPVTLKEAALGVTREVDTLDGRVALKIPKWSSSDRVLRLKGKGLPLRSGERADLYIHIRIMLPEEGDPALEAFLKKQP